MSDRDQEDDYFRKLDAEARARLKAKLDADAAATQAAERAELHRNRCGKCGNTLSPQAFRGIEIDVCGTCGAVVLDPGELQQLAGDDTTGVLGGLFAAFGARRK